VNSNKSKILLIGSQGSGKSTQSKLLSKYLSVPFIETGTILRNLSEEETASGIEIKERLSKGEMVSDDIVAELVEKRLKEKGCENGFVMNGYPRNLNQIKLFDPGFTRVFYLKIDDNLILDRLLKRGREDDTQVIIEKRLSDYHSLTEPILDYYKNSGILETVNGEESVDSIQSKIRSRLND